MNTEVRLSASAVEILLSIPSPSDARLVASRLKALETFPELGAFYAPDYPAALPDHAVRVTYAGHMGIYYVCEKNPQGISTVYVEWIRDERMDPQHPFA